MIRVSRVLNGTEAEGPGRRTAVWFQGCSIRCAGCINPHLFSKTGGFDIHVDEIIKTALSSGDEGLTLLGGEPLDQLDSAFELAIAAQNQGLGVICFTGYEYASMKNNSKYASLLNCVDLLVDGPYQSNSPDQSRPLVGSSNQGFIYLSERYKSQNIESNKNRLEFRISADGTSEVAGFLREDQLLALTEVTSSNRRKRSFVES